MKKESLSLFKILLSLHVFTGVVSIVSGLMLVLAPGGEMLGLPLELLEGTMFSDFLVPGLALTFLVGLSNIVAALVITREGKIWWYASLVAADMLLIFVVVEVAIVGYVSFLQPVFGLVALVMNFLAVLAKVKTQPTTKNQSSTS